MVIVAAALLAHASLGAAAQTSGGAVDPPAPGSGQILQSWGLAPTGTDPTQPSSRPNFTYELTPGSTANDSATLWNFSNVQVTFNVYATDAYNNRQGDFTILPANLDAKDIGSWVTLSTNAVTVEPNTRVDIPFTVTVPNDASPGDHTAGIVASVPTSTTTPQGRQVPIDRRTGSRVYVRVAGPVNPSLTVENMSTEYHSDVNPLDGKFDVSYTLRNNGNVRLGARQVLRVKDVFGRVIDERSVRRVPELLPGNEYTVTETFTGVAALVRLSAEVEVKPFSPQGVSEKAPEPTTSSSGTWAIPWTLLLVLALAILGWRLFRRYRDHSSVPSRSAPSSPGPARA
jgi:hypothetical protein